MNGGLIKFGHSVDNCTKFRLYATGPTFFSF